MRDRTLGKVRDHPTTRSAWITAGPTACKESGLGLYDYNARYYDPYINRWIQPDTIILDPGNPQSFNRYSYVYSNPLRYQDSSGHWPEPPEGGPGRSVSDQARGLAGGLRVLGSLVGLSEWSVSVGGAMTQLGEWCVPGLVAGALDGPAPVGEGLAALPAIAIYRELFDPVENVLGWSGLAITAAADLVGGYTYIEGGEVNQWKVVIGQNTVEDYRSAALGQITSLVPIGLIDVAINTDSMLDGFQDVLGTPTSEWIIELNHDPEVLSNPFSSERFLNIYERTYD
jgi:RHS repeat-associated protein